MRRTAIIIGVALSLFAAMDARGDELRMLAATDFFATTAAPSSTEALGNAEMGFTLRGEWRGIARRALDARGDFRGRLSFIGGGASRYELFDLHVVARDLLGRLDLQIGRFHAPVGFWLILDGAGVKLRLREGVMLHAYGGLRAFTTGRIETHLTSNPVALPLAGLALSLHFPSLQVSASVTYTQDRMDLQRGGSALVSTDASGRPLVDNELFAQVSALVLPHPKWMLGGAVTLGSRYDLQFSGATPFANPNIDAAIVGSLIAHAFVEWRPLPRLRVAYLFDFQRVRIFQSRLLSGGEAASGSYEDHQLKAGVRVWRGARVEARYRLRFRENTDVIHRIEAGLYGDGLIVGLGAFATLGMDLYSTFHIAGRDPSRIVYQAGLSYVAPWLDVRAGLLYVDSFGGCSQPLSSPSMTPAGTCTATAQLFPFVLEAQRVAFLRAFGSWNGLFAGADVEANLDFNQWRFMAQVGYAR